MYIIMPIKKPRGRPRKFAGPKMRTGAFKSKKGLNKTQKKESTAIAKRAVNAVHKIKYFNVERQDAPNAPRVSASANALKQVSVIGYSSTIEKNAAGQNLSYGGQTLIPLKLTRRFVDDGTNTNPAPTTDPLHQMCSNAAYIVPKSARTVFSIERVRYLVEQNNTTASDKLLAFTLPICCRVVTIEFRNVSGTNTDQKPELDLFLDQTGIPTGIDDGKFDRLDARLAPINTKLYKKISDRQFTINQNNIITPIAEASAVNFSDMVTEKGGSSFKHIAQNYQISARKGGKLYFEMHDHQTPTSGQKRQLTLFHFWYQNGHLLVGSPLQPLAPGSIAGADTEAVPTHVNPDIQIKHRSVATFMDAQ